MDRRVAALGGADRPRAADVVRVGGRACCCGPLRRSRPIGWIGGRYRTSKPICGDVGQPRLAVAERAVRAGVAAARARETSRTSAEKRARSRSTTTGSSAGYVVANCGRDSAARSPPARRRARARAARARPARSRSRVAHCASASRSSPVARCAAAVDQVGAGLRRDAQVLGVDAAREIVAPRQEGVDPGRDRVAIAADRRRRRTRRASGRSRARSSASRASAASSSRRYRTARRRRRSWPSAKQSASTSTGSPTTRLTAKRPPSTAGAMFSMTARARPSAGHSGRRFSAPSMRAAIVSALSGLEEQRRRAAAASARANGSGRARAPAPRRRRRDCPCRCRRRCARVAVQQLAPVAAAGHADACSSCAAPA